MFEFHTDIATLQGNRYIQGNGITQYYFFLQQKVMQLKLRYFKQIVGLLFFLKILHQGESNLALSSGFSRVPTD